jgi:hypothetical protein
VSHDQGVTVAALLVDIPGGTTLFGLTWGQVVFTVIIIVVSLLMYLCGWATRDMVCQCRTENAARQRQIRQTLAEARRLERSRQEQVARDLAAQRLLEDESGVLVTPRGAPRGKQHRASNREDSTRRVPVRHRARDKGKPW